MPNQNPPLTQTMNKAFFESPIAIGSHRGIVLTLQPAPAPNTLEALTHPNNQAAQYIECDLQLDPNNNIVLYHDPINPQNPPQNLLSLDTLLTEYENKTTKLYLELKYYETAPHKKETLVTQTLNILNKHQAESKSAIASFDPELLKISHQQNPHIPLILNLDLHSHLSRAYELSNQALTHPIQHDLSYIAPHIDDIKNLKLPNLPKLIWEGSREQKIYNTLKKMETSETQIEWCQTHNIVGLTTNTVKEISRFQAP